MKGEEAKQLLPVIQAFAEVQRPKEHSVSVATGQCDLNADKGVVRAVKNLLSKISNATFVTDTIASYNEIFTCEYGQ